MCFDSTYTTVEVLEKPTIYTVIVENLSGGLNHTEMLTRGLRKLLLGDESVARAGTHWGSVCPGRESSRG